ncbi:ABC transporter-like protein [Salinisphaera sp. PC39]|uniref:ABC transporter ATP-binding protein n=1 Tax=Salinisphaera sp. PC39 TaxID=1304156 RepID=UPI00333FE769
MRLELEGIAHEYGSTRVLDDLSLTLEAGRIGCLLGPSGCGKTTALRCIAGFEPIRAGAIRINGETVSTPAHTLPPERRRIGMVFQDYALLPHLTALDNVAFGLHRLPRRRRRDKAREFLRLVGLSRSDDRYPHQLSGGQQQRVALARALAPEPRLVLLDEPFSSLDVDLREHLVREVRDILKRCRATALMVTHDQLEAFAIADEVGVMRAGRIEQWDSPYNLYHRPATRFVADFVGQGALVRGRIAEDGAVEIELGRLQGRLVHRPPTDEISVLLRPDDVVHDDTSPLHATVRHKAFRGAEILYTLALPSGEHVLAMVPSHHNHAIGERIGIRLETDHIVAFPRD